MIIFIFMGIASGCYGSWALGIFFFIVPGGTTLTFGFTILAYNGHARKLRKKIIGTYGEVQFQEQLKHATIASYPDSMTGQIVLYLTDAFIYVRDLCVIDYQKIILMKSELESSKAGDALAYHYNIVLTMTGGEEIYIQKGININNIEEIMKICLGKNPYIITSWGQQDYGTYLSDYAKRREAGMTMSPTGTPIPPTNVDYRIPIESTTRGLNLEHYTRIRPIFWLPISLGVLFLVLDCATYMPERYPDSNSVLIVMTIISVLLILLGIYIRNRIDKKIEEYS